jgi:hypothetical protein
MTQAELSVLRDILGLILRLPADVRSQVGAWLTPEAAKPNGRDPHPPPLKEALPKSGELPPSPRRSPTPYAGKARHGSSKAAERRLLAALQEHSGASVNALAKAAGANRSSTGERLRGLASRGVVTKDGGGHWRLVGDLAGEAAGPTARPSS